MPEVDPDVLAEALLAAGTRRDCPICGGQRWVSLGELQNLLVKVPISTYDLTPLPDDLAVSAFPLACVNCGFIRLHATHVLMQRAKESEEE